MYLNTRGFDQYVDVTGEGIPLLCLPAFPFPGIMYREQAALADVARVIRPDYRGTGRSSFTDGPYTMDLLADDMLAVLDGLQIEKAVVLGVSMGDYVAFSLYDRHPERFLGFVIADTRAEADSPETQQRRQQTVEGLRTQGTAILHDRVNDLFAATTRAQRPALVEEMQQYALRESAAGLAEITRGMALRPDRTALLPTITVPTMVICGDEDTVSPPEGMARMAAAIPGASFHRIAGAGHLAVLEQPTEFNAIVRDFLTGLGG